jgi:hypothetical protein
MLLITGAMMLGVFTIVKPASEDGWLAGRTLAFGAVAVGLLDRGRPGRGGHRGGRNRAALRRLKAL